MKRLAAIVLGILGACTTGNVMAQSHEVRADVPFTFAVGNKQLPAGHYTFSTEPNDTIIIRDNQGQIAVLSNTYDTEALAGYSSRLIFNKYGDRYFLREIRCPSIALNVELPASKSEKQIRVQRASLGPERTLLALN